MRYTLRELLARIDDTLKEIKASLDTKASILVVNALRSDLDALASQVGVLRAAFDTKEAGVRGVLGTLRRVAGLAGWAIATALVIYGLATR